MCSGKFETELSVNYARLDEAFPSFTHKVMIQFYSDSDNPANKTVNFYRLLNFFKLDIVSEIMYLYCAYGMYKKKKNR